MGFDRANGGVLRLMRYAAGCALSISLGACGSGDNGPVGSLSLSVLVAGQPLNTGYVQAGAVQSVSLYAGQSIELDGSEPVYWTLYVGGSAVPEYASVSYAGVTITETTVSPSRVVIDTFAPYPLPAAVPVTLVATSRYDAALIATVNVLIM